MTVNPRNVLGVGFGSSPGLCRGSFIYSRPERFYAGSSTAAIPSVLDLNRHEEIHL